ncbi:MAG TPA: DUF1549 domain-containing protein [Pirellulales bacterium]|jgi:hypothetical protein|nr:DUF1549 domain-containing protein [Pirellulales bacterium]
MIYFGNALRWTVGVLCCACALAGSGGLAGAATGSFQVTPAEVKLAGNFEQAQLVVTATPSTKQAATPDAAARLGDLTRGAEFSSSNTKVVTVDKRGRLLARGNGQAIVTVSVSGGADKVQMPVEVAGYTSQPKVGFGERISPILSKAGCNAAACHASQHGKGGFKLSVFGYDPAEDYAAIVRDRQGRRVNLVDPARSLVLLKPTLLIPHGGNRRLSVGSVDYEIVRAWLASGAPAPSNSEPQVVSLQVFPPRRIAKEGVYQQLRVTAIYSTGQVRDVTAWAKFDSMDEGIVTVTPDGVCRTVGRGQGVVMVRFEGQAELCQVVVPYSDKVDLKQWKNNNFVDELAAAKFREMGISPSGLCDDGTFLRRAMLDAVGTAPTLEETKTFLASKDPDKRSKLIDRLLGLTGDPALDVHNNDYAAYWSIKWADLIRSTSGTLGEQGMWAMHNWIKESLRVNKPFDQFVRELVTAQGSIYRNGPANYYRVTSNPLDLAESTSQLFLGVRLTCAKCHHHPFEKYSQDDYYGFAAYFARVGTKTSQEFGLFGREQIVLVKSTGEVKHPKSGKTMAPKPLEAEPSAEVLDRRVPLAQWLTSKQNKFFAENLANRYVAYLLGRGLVEPVDDLRATNPASDTALLEALSNDFVASGFDIKQLMRRIMTSRLYQLDSQPTEGNSSDHQFYSHYSVKRLAAEPLLDAIDYATGVRTKFKNMPLGTRAIELPDAEYPDYFLTTFGKPKRASVCECERSPDENLSQALHTLNGDTLAAKIANSKGRVAALVKSKTPADEAIRELYLVALSREPSKQEATSCQKLLKDSPNETVFYEDLLWSLINSKQFLFIH